MIRRSSLLTLAATFALSATTYGQDRPLPIAQKHIMPNAVRLQFTPKGMTYFNTQLLSLIENQGYSLREGYFPGRTMDFPLNMKELEQKNPEGFRMYKTVRDMLEKWLVGFTLTDHRPAVKIGESSYEATFSKFSLVTDEALMEKLGKTEGAVLAIELEVRKLDISAQAVRVWDMNNFKMLDLENKLGFDNPSLIVGAKDAPLKIRLPFYLKTNAQGGMEIEALEVQENLISVPLEVKYQKLVAPEISIVVDGKVQWQMNKKQLQATFDNQLPTVLVEVRKYLSDFSRNQLPQLLNEKLKQNMAGISDHVQTMMPPGHDVEKDKRPPFQWGTIVKTPQLKKGGFLNLNIDTYVEDPINANVNLVDANKSRGLPTLGAMPTDAYDLAVTVDRAMINRLLQLSFLRKNFEKIKQKDGSFLKLTAAPVVDYIKAVGPTADNETYLKLRVAVEQQPGSFWLKDTIIIAFDIVAKLKPNPKGSGMIIAQQSIDRNSLAMDKSYLSLAGRLISGKVMEGIREKLDETCRNWIRDGEALEGSLDVPPSFMGVNFDLNKILLDPNGHLIMYLSYKQSGVLK